MTAGINRKLAYLVQASIALNSSTDTRALLRYLLRVATEVLECESASILLYDERQRQLFFVAATGSRPLERAPVPLDRSIAGEAFRKGEPLVIHNAERDPRHFSAIGQQIGMQVRTLLAVPLMARGRKVGVLEALNKTQGTFTKEDIRLARILAAQAGVAIHNAQVMEDMRRAYASLERAKRTQEEMLALASHELRTPLGIIMGYASLLQQDAQGAQAEFAQALVNAALKMRTIVDEMTHFVQARQGRVVFRQDVFPLQQVLRQAVDAAQPALKEKQLRLETRWPENDPLWVRGDAEKLHQALGHLLDNAARFTPKGGQIRVLAWREGNEVFARVEDNGVGIPPEELEAIFEEFHQAENHLTRRYGGLGLGLSITRNLVRLHGGRIWAESEGPGRGARFTVALPASPPPKKKIDKTQVPRNAYEEKIMFSQYCTVFAQKRRHFEKNRYKKYRLGSDALPGDLVQRNTGVSLRKNGKTCSEKKCLAEKRCVFRDYHKNCHFLAPVCQKSKELGPGALPLPGEASDGFACPRLFPLRGIPQWPPRNIASPPPRGTAAQRRG